MAKKGRDRMSTQIMQVSKHYGDVKALQSVDLSIRKGEFIAVLGPSGCGKTTLLRLIAGFDSPSDGQICIDGQVVGTPRAILPPEQRNIGMVFQSFALWPHMKVKEQVLFPLQYHKAAAREANLNKEKRVREVLEMVGLQHLAERLPRELSGGQKQRVAIARAISANPSLLLMDEPLSSLDIELRMDLRREIQALHRRTQASIIYVTHDQGEALAMADRIVVMKDGKIEQTGTPEEIYEKPATLFVATFVGKTNLIRGKWEKGVFQPDLAVGAVQWPDRDFPLCFKEKQVFPVRPEQLRIVLAGPGIAGRIINRQYLGKEIHYTVGVGPDIVGVHAGNHCSFEVGQEVYLQLGYLPVTI
ncbi:hypothetical protein P22_1130 [Propionispora sp. 2/2-37]|uniref:ABC transporter ATP-binding protein n=1 Tax=Propionispora sp. 2/2-37 TaxID=1677858 RepID=UPI0006C590AE|nr:ABC transporter ATP-binding protein [Propionispora sp. 2/2-37]CUH95061.1 hypothetical protein P22_1130 [Propionispora sp. 2/2-37]